MVYSIYLLSVLISLAFSKLILGEYLPVPFWIVYLPLIPVIIVSFIFLINHLKVKKEIKEKEFQKALRKESVSKRKEIEKLYKKIKDTEHKGIYDKKVFVIIDTVNQLNEENLSGNVKNRVQEMINKSLKLYILNLKIAVKMIEVSRLDMNFDKEIEEIVKQNKEIINKLKEVITKLIILDTKESKFETLISNFESSLQTLEIIKEKREEEL